MKDEIRPFFVRRRSRRDGLVVEIGGECDAATVDELNDGLRDAVNESPAQLTVLCPSCAGGC